MRVFKSISMRPETLKKLEDVFGDIDTINFSRMTDKALCEYAESFKKKMEES